VSNNYLPIKIGNGDPRSLIFKCSDDANGNFSNFVDLNNRFDSFQSFEKLF
jgi:hypothetical protein